MFRYAIRKRFNLLVVGVVLLTMLFTAVLLWVFISDVAQRVSKDYAVIYNSDLVGQLQAYIEPEIALAQKMAVTESLKRWLIDPQSDDSGKQAFEELLAYATVMHDKNLFVVPQLTKQVYFISPENNYATFVPEGTLSMALDTDLWYYNAISSEMPYQLNIDYDRFLSTIKVWINVKVVNEGRAIGVVGTGLELDTLLQSLFLKHETSGVKTILINKYGDIQVDSNIQRINQNSFEPSTVKNETIYSYGTGTDFNNSIDYYLSSPKEDYLVEIKGAPFRYAVLTPLPNTEWHVVTFFSHTALYNVSGFSPVVWIALFAAILMGFSVNSLAHKTFVEPFERLNESIAKKESFQEHPIYGIDRRDEFGLLANNIQKMSDRLVQSIPVGLFLMDSNFNVSYGNSYFLSQFGHGNIGDFQKALQEEPTRFFSDHSEAKRIREALYLGHSYYTFDVELVSTSGETFWAELKLTQISAPDASREYEGILLNVQTKKEYEEKLLSLVNTDQLTGIYNRHYFDEIVSLEVSRSDRYGEPISLVIFDLDHFKKVNDQWGHAIGDEVLIRTVEEAGKCIRKNDKLFRWGGEEFAVLMPSTPLSGAYQVSEKIRARLEQYTHDLVGTVTASFGVAERGVNEFYKSWFDRVDRAMFKAKDMGRNLVVASDLDEAFQSTFIQLSWQDTFCSGNETIDQQHQKIFVLANALMEIGTKPHPHDLEVVMFNAIVKHIVAHLEDEEAILKASAFPAEAFSRHQSEHERLKRHMFALQTDLVNKNISPLDIFITLINEVVIGHLMSEDVKFFPYLIPHVQS